MHIKCLVYVEHVLCWGKSPESVRHPLSLLCPNRYSLSAGCPYSCVKRAPHAFSFTGENGTACAMSQGLATFLISFLVIQKYLLCLLTRA